MTAKASNVSPWRWDAQAKLRSYIHTFLFSTAIAVLLWSLNISGPGFLSGLLVSLSIGFGINTAFVLLQAPLGNLIGWYVAPIPITALGLLFGLVIAGWLVLSDPWYFLSEDYSSLLIGVFFGVVGYVMISTYARLSETQAELAKAEAHAARQEQQILSTELRLLQAQIEPHFLFNTLSNVTSLIHTDPDKAEATLHNLTRFLRVSLRRTRKERIDLADELSVVRAYLEIQQVRMGKRLQYDIQVSDSLNATSLPPLLLQPLVENAVKHGIEPAEAGGTVTVCATELNNRLTLSVADTGRGIHEHNGGTQVGVRNIRERLQALYGDDARLTLRDNQPSGVIAEIQLPIVPKV